MLLYISLKFKMEKSIPQVSPHYFGEFKIDIYHLDMNNIRCIKNPNHQLMVSLSHYL